MGWLFKTKEEKIVATNKEIDALRAKQRVLMDKSFEPGRANREIQKQIEAETAIFDVEKTKLIAEYDENKRDLEREEIEIKSEAEEWGRICQLESDIEGLKTQIARMEAEGNTANPQYKWSKSSWVEKLDEKRKLKRDVDDRFKGRLTIPYEKKNQILQETQRRIAAARAKIAKLERQIEENDRLHTQYILDVEDIGRKIVALKGDLVKLK